VPLREGLLRLLSFPLRFQVYGLKITPRSGPKCSPSNGGTKARCHPHQQKQYFIPHKAQVRIQKNFDRLLKYGILQTCQSSWNTPLLPVQKLGTEDLRPVQDFWAVNSATVTLHPVVLNPYMLLGLAPTEAKFFTCLYLNDTFFCIHLASQSQPIFAFQWEISQHWRKEATNLDFRN
jgi:hypothetical protein